MFMYHEVAILFTILLERERDNITILLERERERESWALAVTHSLPVSSCGQPLGSLLNSIFNQAEKRTEGLGASE